MAHDGAGIRTEEISRYAWLVRTDDNKVGLLFPRDRQDLVIDASDPDNGEDMAAGQIDGASEIGQGQLGLIGNFTFEAHGNGVEHHHGRNFTSGAT